MIVKVPQNFVVTTVDAPASKSYAQRAILAATLCNEPSIIKGVGKSEDVENIINIARQLGAEISGSDSLSIVGRKQSAKLSLNCGESGLGIRMTASVAAAIGGEYIISGTGSILNRPMNVLADILPQLGIEFKSNEGFPPLHINGVLQGGKAVMDGSESSQYLTGLLLALPVAGQHSELHVSNLVSTPYVQMTLDLLDQFGIQIEHDNYEVFKIRGNQKYAACEYRVEGDWSGAAFWVVYGAINGPIEINGLNKDSLQADIRILNAISAAGGNYHWNDNVLFVDKAPINTFEFDATNCPDLFPILVVLAAAAQGISTIKGISRLTHKESNRAVALQKEFSKLGLKIELENDNMIIQGTAALNSNATKSHNDHRIAMALAVAATLTEEGINITEAEAVNKSYPEFWETINY
jgi:3-phosphoshikimate 1-carboxyvinyltransferase